METLRHAMGQCMCLCKINKQKKKLYYPKGEK